MKVSVYVLICVLGIRDLVSSDEKIEKLHVPGNEIELNIGTLCTQYSKY